MPEVDGWVLGSDAARAVGRFNPAGPDGYRAATAPNAPLRKTRKEAASDERAYLTTGDVAEGSAIFDLDEDTPLFGLDWTA